MLWDCLAISTERVSLQTVQIKTSATIQIIGLYEPKQGTVTES